MAFAWAPDSVTGLSIAAVGATIVRSASVADWLKICTSMEAPCFMTLTVAELSVESGILLSEEAPKTALIAATASARIRVQLVTGDALSGAGAMSASAVVAISTDAFSGGATD